MSSVWLSDSQDRISLKHCCRSFPWLVNKCFTILFAYKNHQYNRLVEPDKRQAYGQMLIGRGQSSDCSAKSISWYLLNTSLSINYSYIMSDNYCRKSGLRNQCQKHIRQKTCSNEDHCRRRGSRGGKQDRRQECAIPDLSIQGWNRSHHLEYCRCGPLCETALGRDLSYHFERPDAVHDGMLQLLGPVWRVVAGSRPSGAPENHPTVCNPFRISKDALCEPNIRVNSANGFRRPFHPQYFWTATYRQCERGLLIYQQSQLHSTDAQAQWPVYCSWLYGEDTVISCHSRQVRYWLCESFQPTISCR